MKRIKDIDLSSSISKKDYKKQLKKLQLKMLTIQQILFNNNIGLILAFEGMDAAGKGGTIKRLTERLDPRGFIVHPISAPLPHELKFHYMHRFWTKLPMHGQIGIFDRSWYGRVLVERIEKYASKEEWTRAYEEINLFEKTLTDENYIMLKFWLHVDRKEQLNRFKERETNPYKVWKLTDEDWRNREKFDEYTAAADEMFNRTDQDYAPWVLIGGNNKQHARIIVLKETIKHVEKELGRRGLNITYVEL
ncbi:polyphosphate kinase 2 (PPK2 family) [Lysinibacillus composti]|uniref:Polyphosphate kinase n=1 Tax=Lysinibacillus composti TaxID=720633 RepID=A0A3N9UGJ9_9BACI|nr:polyphosphate kinase [Lysinibacillus composti]MBM7608190.1 polyphosphate kinase 2 (PPK2 family) [Lysinibacillus composti]RQW75254.1 polyphosphate kinase [Lysinibacillus composti]